MIQAAGVLINPPPIIFYMANKRFGPSSVWLVFLLLLAEFAMAKDAITGFVTYMTTASWIIIIFIFIAVAFWTVSKRFH